MDDKLRGKLDESLLEGVTGGVVFDARDISGADPSHPFEVLDDKNGTVLGRFTSMNDAMYAAGTISQNHMVVNWDQVLQLRGQK
ncbi:MAG: hypothetical protein K6F73_08095 [Lachnospiraceae bacterium]|nr:hypothetical protein [Lachnospiraceae bacterium]